MGAKVNCISKVLNLGSQKNGGATEINWYSYNINFSYVPFRDTY